MSNKLDMSLDDMIRNSRRSGPHNVNNPRGRGRASGPGPDRRFATRNLPRTAPYYPPQAIQMMNPILPQQMVLGSGSMSNTEDGTKLYISNLEYGVTNDDIKVLFSEIGDLKRYSIHYDRSGRSKGTAEVVFLRQSDAVAAIKRYNDVQLDGKPMKIELVGVNLVTPPVVPPITHSILGKPNFAFRSGHGRAGPGGWVRGGGGIGSGGIGGGPARGRARAKGHVEKVTAEDLDADLEKYRLEAMQIN
ncbi:THO complex subunit 4A-like [Fagus crenata]